MMRAELLRSDGVIERDPALDAWMKDRAGELEPSRVRWFEVMRKCGDEVRELLHDGCPLACLGDAPFGYVIRKPRVAWDWRDLILNVQLDGHPLGWWLAQ
jgi:hypothetical protein